MKRFGISAALALALIALSVPLGAGATGSHSSPPPGPPVQFTHGIASGDVTQSRAILWTRVDGPSKVTVEVSWNPWFWGPKSFKGKVTTSAERDFTVKIDAKHLWPGLRYWYRFKSGDGHNANYSDVGTFKTAPWQFLRKDVEYTYDGDSDTTRVASVNPFNNWEVLDRAREENGDFFVYLGDTIYSDSSHRTRRNTTGPAVTLDQYRDTYKEGRTLHRADPAAQVDFDLLVDGRPRDRERLRRQDGRPGPLRGRPAGVPGVHADPRDGPPARPVLRR